MAYNEVLTKPVKDLLTTPGTEIYTLHNQLVGKILSVKPTEGDYTLQVLLESKYFRKEPTLIPLSVMFETMKDKRFYLKSQHDPEFKYGQKLFMNNEEVAKVMLGRTVICGDERIDLKLKHPLEDHLPLRRPQNNTLEVEVQKKTLVELVRRGIITLEKKETD